jgi:HK97 family phage major capsid protein
MSKKEIEEIKDEEESEDTELEDEEIDEDEEDAKEELKSFIQKETFDASDKALDAKLDAIADSLVSKFFDGVEKQRSKAINTKEVKSDTKQEQVRKWFSALLSRDVAALKAYEKDYLRTDDNAQGGFLVPTPLVAEINRFTTEYGVARREMRYLPFSGPGNSRQIPALLSSIGLYWTDQGAAKSSTKPTFKLVTQTLKKLAAIVPMTEEVLEDSAVDIIRLLGELFGEAIAEEEDRVFLAGDTGDGDPFMGVINAVGAVTTDLGAGETAEDVTADNLNDMIYAIPAAARKGAKFFLNSTVFSALQQLQTDDGHYIVQQPTGEKPGTIWNYPYELVDVLPDSTTAAGQNPFMFFANLGRTCVYGDKGGMRVKLLEEGIVSSAESSPSDLNLATQDMVALRVVKRVGYVPVLPAGISVLRTGT